MTRSQRLGLKPINAAPTAIAATAQSRRRMLENVQTAAHPVIPGRGMAEIGPGRRGSVALGADAAGATSPV